MQLTQAFTILAEFLLPTYEAECMYFVTDLEKYTFVHDNGLSLTDIKVGLPITTDSIIGRCLQEGHPINVVDKKSAGEQFKFFVRPIIEDHEIKGCFGVITRRVHSIIRAFPHLAEPLANAFPEGATLAVTDLEKIIYCQGSKKFDNESKNGEPLRKGGMAEECIKTGCAITRDLRRADKMTRAITIPIFDPEDKTVVGLFLLTLARIVPETLKDMASKLSSSSQEIASVVETVAASACEISSNEECLSGKVEEMVGTIEEIREILEFIKNVADQTKMLGLNAAIEAARAGEHGRGFGVVAEEIRKLSDQSKETAERIGKLTMKINRKMQEVTKISAETLKQSQEQAAATEQISASILEMAQMAEKLTETAQDL